MPEAFWRCARCGTPNPWASYLTQCVGCGAERPKQRPAETKAEPAKRPAFRPGRAFWFAGGYLVVLVVVLGLVRLVGESWWPAALLVFGPRGVFLLPLLPLAWIAWRRKRRATAVVVGLSALLILGPLMGFGLPLGNLLAGS